MNAFEFFKLFGLLGGFGVGFAYILLWLARQ